MKSRNDGQYREGQAIASHIYTDMMDKLDKHLLDLDISDRCYNHMFTFYSGLYMKVSDSIAHDRLLNEDLYDEYNDALGIE